MGPTSAPASERAARGHRPPPPLHALASIQPTATVRRVTAPWCTGLAASRLASTNSPALTFEARKHAAGLGRLRWAVQVPRSSAVGKCRCPRMSARRMLAGSVPKKSMNSALVLPTRYLAKARIIFHLLLQRIRSHDPVIPNPGVVGSNPAGRAISP